MILFGIGVLQVLTTAPAGLIDQVPKDLARLGRRIAEGRRWRPTKRRRARSAGADRPPARRRSGRLEARDRDGQIRKPPPEEPR